MKYWLKMGYSPQMWFFPIPLTNQIYSNWRNKREIEMKF